MHLSKLLPVSAFSLLCLALAAKAQTTNVIFNDTFAPGTDPNGTTNATRHDDPGSLYGLDIQWRPRIGSQAGSYSVVTNDPAFTNALRFSNPANYLWILGQFDNDAFDGIAFGSNSIPASLAPNVNDALELSLRIRVSRVSSNTRTFNCGLTFFPGGPTNSDPGTDNTWTDPCTGYYFGINETTPALVPTGKQLGSTSVTPYGGAAAAQLTNGITGVTAAFGTDTNAHTIKMRFVRVANGVQINSFWDGALVSTATDDGTIGSTPPFTRFNTLGILYGTGTNLAGTTIDYFLDDVKLTRSLSASYHAPVAVNDAFTMVENTALTVAAPGVLGNDFAYTNTPLTALKLADPQHGSLALNSDGSFAYTPATNYTGTDSFAYQASDGTSNSAAATVMITVNASTPPNTNHPVITIEATTPYGTIFHGAVGANHLWLDSGDGTVNSSDGSFKRGYVDSMNQMALGSLRWPCGTRANLFLWKRAIGPPASRTPTPLGQDTSGYGNQICYFGPDECGKLRDSTGMDIAVLINCATADSSEAADLVEYLNARQGTNPRGGIAWADVRAANGHPAPYGFNYFEIGNEYNLAGQNYWLDPLWGNRTAYAQTYALGGSTTWTSNGVVTGIDFSSNGMLGDGTANQVKFARYPPVDSTQPYALYVSGVAWTCVTRLAASSATGQVYTLDFPTGTITFGDGVHGAKPASGASIALSYTCGRHDGFVDYYREMKAVDPSIKIYSPLDWTEFCAAMGTNHPYDGLVRHLYPFYGQTITTPTEDTAWAYRVTSPQYYFYNNIVDHYGLIAKGAGGQARGMNVVVTEFGAPDLAVTTPDPGEQISGMPLRDAFWYALLMQASSAYGLPLCLKHMLISGDGASDEKKQFLFHVGSGFPVSALGHAAGQVARLKDRQLLACWTANNPIAATDPSFGSRQALQVTAAQDTNGALWLLVLNLNRSTNYATTINPLGFINSGTASVWTANGTNDWSNNWDGHTNDVTTTFQTLSVPTGSFSYTFPSHSITVMQLPKALANGGLPAVCNYTFTNSSAVSNACYPSTNYLPGEWYLAGKAAVVSVTNLDPAAGYALQLTGQDPSHGRATLTLGPSYTNGVVHLSADVWSAGSLSNPLYVSFCDDNRTSVVAVAFSLNHDGLISDLGSNGVWQATQVPYYQNNWQTLDIIVDLDAGKHDLLISGYKVFVGGEGRDNVLNFTNPVNKVSFETSGTSGDSGTFYIDNVTVSRFVTNTAPTLLPVANRAILAGQILLVTNTASDPDLPSQSLAWTLLSGPANATLSPLNATNALLTWRPTLAQVLTQATFRIRVNDNGLPPFSATQSFQVAVSLPTRPRFTNCSLSDNGQCLFWIAGDSGPDYSLYTSTNLLSWDLLLTTNPPVLPFPLSLPATNYPQRFFQMRLGP